jgi:hypothetical protein
VSAIVALCAKPLIHCIRGALHASHGTLSMQPHVEVYIVLYCRTTESSPCVNSLAQINIVRIAYRTETGERVWGIWWTCKKRKVCVRIVASGRKWSLPTPMGNGRDVMYVSMYCLHKIAYFEFYVKMRNGKFKTLNSYDSITLALTHLIKVGDFSNLSLFFLFCPWNNL